MTSCQCQGIESVFSDAYVARELGRYQRKGASRTTRMLTKALTAEGLDGGTLLDIGSGVGAIPHLLLASGMRAATCVEASSAYAEAAMREARRRGLDTQIRLLQGDFVNLAPQVGEHDVVTLDRVICCYDDLDSLLGMSGARARKLLGLVYPRENGLARLLVSLLNGVMRLRGSPFRNYVHSSKRLEAILSRMGFTRRYFDRTLGWQVAVYAR